MKFEKEQKSGKIRKVIKKACKLANSHGLELRTLRSVDSKTETSPESESIRIKSGFWTVLEMSKNFFSLSKSLTFTIGKWLDREG